MHINQKYDHELLVISKISTSQICFFSPLAVEVSKYLAIRMCDLSEK